MALKRVTLGEVGTYAMILCAVALTANTLYTTYQRARDPSSGPWKTVSDWRSYANGGNRIGPKNARLTLVIFSDYQCPVCLNLEHHLRDLEARHPDDLTVVVRQFPLLGHPFAKPAAFAAECAAAQGRFASYHQELFAQQATLERQPWLDIAQAVGVPDTSAFAECMQSSRTATATDADIADGTRLGVFGTPTVLIENEGYIGVPADFDGIVERHLALRTTHP